MRFMIIGSCPLNDHDYDHFKDYCREIANVLLKNSATLIISSLFEDSADYWVYETFVQSSQNIELHYWDTVGVRDRINKVIGEQKISLYPYLDDNTKLDNKYAYLLCQLNALRNADAIIAIGGQENGSANLLLSFADRTKLIIPFIRFNGAAKAYYDNQRFKLQDLLKNSRDGVLVNGNVDEIIGAFAALLRKEQAIPNPNNKEKKIFLSYAQENSKWADMAEIFLRRRNVNLFRDETDIRPGANIQENIINELRSSDIVIALWCKEYACSPWCMDEIEEALDLKDKIQLCILCVDDTRIVPKRARGLDYKKVNSRQELELCLFDLLI